MVKRWDIVTIGNLSRNRYWGEGEDRAVRPSLCTSTLILVPGHRLLVDPQIADMRRMAAELDRRTGLKTADIDAVMTRDFWADRRGFFSSADPAQASRTMESLAQIADAIVPGHDNGFPIDRVR